MHLVLSAAFAELFEFQAILEDFLVLGRTVVQGLTDGALQFDEIVLGHTAIKMLAKVYGNPEELSICQQS